METVVGEVVEATVSDAIVPACVPELSVLLCALEALFCALFVSALEEPSAVAMAALSVSETGSALKSKGVMLEKRIGALPRS